jgi:ABC-type multidrug transport system fused ATPase/permease subunit
MVAGRVAAAIAAEIGTMKVTEQIDALVTLSTNPMKYLTVPRVLAATLSLPVLVAVGDIIGIFGGYLVGTTRLGFNAAAYLNNTRRFPRGWDVSRACQGRGLRLHRGDHGLLSRHASGPRRARRGAGDDQGRGLRLDPDPGRELHPDGGVLLGMIRLIEMVTKSFGPKAVLRGIDLTVSTGESLVIIGGSGTGKSVLAEMHPGPVKPDGGTIELDGRT